MHRSLLLVLNKYLPTADVVNCVSGKQSTPSFRLLQHQLETAHAKAEKETCDEAALKLDTDAKSEADTEFGKLKLSITTENQRQTDALNKEGTDLDTKYAVNEYLSGDATENSNIVLRYGELPYWNVSQVTNMESLFADRPTFNGNLEYWITTGNGEWSLPSNIIFTTKEDFDIRAIVWEAKVNGIEALVELMKNPRFIENANLQTRCVRVFKIQKLKM